MIFLKDLLVKRDKSPDTIVSGDLHLPRSVFMLAGNGSAKVIGTIIGSIQIKIDVHLIKESIALHGIGQLDIDEVVNFFLQKSQFGKGSLIGDTIVDSDFNQGIAVL